MLSSKFDLYMLLAEGMGPDLYWFPQDVPLTQLAATLVGMANSSGGTVILGVAPRSNHVQGVRDLTATLDRIFQALLLVDPLLVVPVPQVHHVGKVDVVQIIIPAGLPHVYNLEGRYLYRQGSQTNPMPARELRKLMFERGLVQFESRFPADVTLDDLDYSQVETYATAYRAALHLEPEKTPEGLNEILLNRGCLKQVGDSLKPTYAALLLFGRQTQRWLPSATILAARFSGSTMTDSFVKQEIAGTLPQQLKQAEAFVRANLQNVVRLVGLVHQETLEYPFEAVRELLVNAVAHRDYNLQGDCVHLNIFSDRLEISSPGGLPGPVNLGNLLEARFSRNAVILQILSDLGYVERLGYGLDRVVTQMRRHALRPPKFEEMSGSFRVSLFNASASLVSEEDLRRYRLMELNPRQIAALTFLSDHRRITSGEFQALCPDVHPETLRRDLAALVGRGVLLKIGDKRATYYILK